MYYTSPSLLCLLCISSLVHIPSVVEIASHSQHQAASYSQLNMFGGFNRGFTQSNSVYVPTSSVFSEVSCISSLSLSCAQLSHPYWYLFDFSVSWSFQVRWGWGNRAAAISQFPKGVITLPDLVCSFALGLWDYLYHFIQLMCAQIPTELTCILISDRRKIVYVCMYVREYVNGWVWLNSS